MGSGRQHRERTVWTGRISSTTDTPSRRDQGVRRRPHAVGVYRTVRLGTSMRHPCRLRRPPSSALTTLKNTSFLLRRRSSSPGLTRWPTRTRIRPIPRLLLDLSPITQRLINRPISPGMELRRPFSTKLESRRPRPCPTGSPPSKYLHRHRLGDRITPMEAARPYRMKPVRRRTRHMASRCNRRRPLL